MNISTSLLARDYYAAYASGRIGEFSTHNYASIIQINKVHDAMVPTTHLHARTHAHTHAHTHTTVYI